MDMVTDRGTTPLQTCLERAAQSLARSYEAGEPALVFPGRPLVRIHSWRRARGGPC